MKRFIIKNCIVFFVMFLFISGVFAQNANINYKNIKNNSTVYYSADSAVWSLSKRCNNCKAFVKKNSDEMTSSSEFYAADGDISFTTGTQYEFIYDGKLIGYSNIDLKFYYYTISENGLIQQNELLIEEVESLFKKAEVIKISEFSNSTNSLKIKKGCGSLKILLLNDTDRTFENYAFTSQNAKFKKYSLAGLLAIKKPGMIQFSRFGDNTKDSPWYILLVR